MKTEIPGLKSAHQIITPECRKNRGIHGAFREAAHRIGLTYDNYSGGAENDGVNWHLVLVREETQG